MPIAAPSGNTSGRPSPTTAAHMIEDMDGKIGGIVDGGPCTVGVESTIIDLTVTPPRLLRPGGLPLESLRQVLGEVAVDKAVTGLLAAGERPRAPGMKYRHYAPHAPVTVVTGAPDRSAAASWACCPDQAGVICFDEYAPLYAGHIIHNLGPAADKSAQARHVFDALRTFDGTDVTEIFAQCPDDGGLGLAVANRLKKGGGLPPGERRPAHSHRSHRRHRRGKDQRPGGAGGPGRHSAGLRRRVSRDAPHGPPPCGAIERAFGPVFGPAGPLDRQKLGNIVFSDPAALERLNAIVYEFLPPELMRRAAGQSPGGAGRHQPGGKRPGPAVRLHRGGAGPSGGSGPPHHGPDGISRDYARLRISAQPSGGFYREHCSHILENTCAGPAQFRIRHGFSSGKCSGKSNIFEEESEP